MSDFRPEIAAGWRCLRFPVAAVLAAGALLAGAGSAAAASADGISPDRSALAADPAPGASVRAAGDSDDDDDHTGGIDPGDEDRDDDEGSSVSIPAQLERIAQCESDGNPSAVSSDGRYRGKYQFLRETWRGLGGTGDPAEAPEAEQDRIALKLYRKRGAAPWGACGRRA